MKGPNFKKMGLSLKKGWAKNNQMVLAVMAGACAVGAVIEAIRATPKATKIKEDRKDQIDTLTIDLQDGEISQEEYKKGVKDANFQAAKEYALCYGTTAALLILSVGSTACNYKISIGKQAALLGAYKALEGKHEEFVEKAKELLGENKVDEIKTSIVKDKIENTKMPDSIKDPVYDKDADGNYLTKPYMYPCWEDWSGRPFMSSASKIEAAMIKASARAYSNGLITMNQIYDLLDPTHEQLPPNKDGDQDGFLDSDLNSEKMLPYRLKAVDRPGFDHSFTAIIFDKDPVNIILDE